VEKKFLSSIISRSKAVCLFGLLISFFYPSDGQVSSAGFKEVRHYIKGVRAMGMGGVSVATVNDETALFVNPSALGKIRDFYGTIFDPEYHFSESTGWLKELFSPFDPEAALRGIRDKPGFQGYARAQISPSMVMRNFGFGAIARYESNYRLSEDGLRYHYYHQSDWGGFAALNIRLWGGRIKIGGSAKLLARVEMDRELDATGDVSLASYATEGIGLGYDAALTLTAPIVWLPTLTAVVRDIGGTRFDYQKNFRMTATERPKIAEQDVDVGFAVSPIHSPQVRSMIGFEYKRAQAASKSQDQQRFMHLGYELNLYDTLFFRLGMNQRYITGGLEFAREFNQFQLATYGEEIGTETRPQEDRRWVIKWAFRY
jgi:hypothetical protein